MKRNGDLPDLEDGAEEPLLGHMTTSRKLVTMVTRREWKDCCLYLCLYLIQSTPLISRVFISSGEGGKSGRPICTHSQQYRSSQILSCHINGLYTSATAFRSPKFICSPRNGHTHYFPTCEVRLSGPSDILINLSDYWQSTRSNH